MRSLAILRSSLVVVAAAVLATAAVQVASLPLHVPVQHLKVAWTLTRVLIQL